MSDRVTITLDRADAERMERFFREAALFRKLVMGQQDGTAECRRFSEMFKTALSAAPDAPAEPVPDWFRELPVSEWSARASHRKASFSEDMERPPAEGPERAATGETGYYVGVDAFGQKVRVANNVHFTDSRKRKRAAVQRAAGEPGSETR